MREEFYLLNNQCFFLQHIAPRFTLEVSCPSTDQTWSCLFLWILTSSQSDLVQVSDFYIAVHTIVDSCLIYFIVIGWHVPRGYASNWNAFYGTGFFLRNAPSSATIHPRHAKTICRRTAVSNALMLLAKSYWMGRHLQFILCIKNYHLILEGFLLNVGFQNVKLVADHSLLFEGCVCGSWWHMLFSTSFMKLRWSVCQSIYVEKGTECETQVTSVQKVVMEVVII